VPARPLRADAQLNHDRLLEVAAEAFARDGADASLKAIAQQAGVGIGTLYRRFPTREALVEATYRSETTRVAEAAGTLLAGPLPAEHALRQWMDLFVDYLATKHGMGDCLKAILTDDGDRMRTRHLLAGALGRLITAGVERGTIRDGLEPYDVLLGLGGIALITGEPDQRALTGRLLDLLLAGLLTRPVAEPTTGAEPPAQVV
jgi:AcrR family transcriptional regulator